MAVNAQQAQLLQAQQSIDVEKQYKALLAEEDRLREQVITLSAEIAQLRRMIFGVRTERFIPAPDATAATLQLALGLSAETLAQCKITSATTVEYVRTRVEVIPAKPKVHSW